MIWFHTIQADFNVLGYSTQDRYMWDIVLSLAVLRHEVPYDAQGSGAEL